MFKFVESFKGRGMSFANLNVFLKIKEAKGVVLNEEVEYGRALLYRRFDDMEALFSSIRERAEKELSEVPHEGLFFITFQKEGDIGRDMFIFSTDTKAVVFLLGQEDEIEDGFIMTDGSSHLTGEFAKLTEHLSHYVESRQGRVVEDMFSASSYRSYHKDVVETLTSRGEEVVSALEALESELVGSLPVEKVEAAKQLFNEVVPDPSRWETSSTELTVVLKRLQILFGEFEGYTSDSENYQRLPAIEALDSVLNGLYTALELVANE